MKYTYKKVYTQVPNRSISLFSEPGFTEVCCGGTFYPENGKPEDCELYLTDNNLIERNKDLQQLCHDYLGSFLGIPKSENSAYIGKWNEDIDKNAKIYFIIDGDTVRKLIMAKFDNLSFSNQNGIQFIADIDGEMQDVLMDEGDIVFTDKKEAEQYIQDKYKKKDNKKDDQRGIETMVAS